MICVLTYVEVIIILCLEFLQQQCGLLRCKRHTDAPQSTLHSNSLHSSHVISENGTAPNAATGDVAAPLSTTRHVRAILKSIVSVERKVLLLLTMECTFWRETVTCDAERKAVVNRFFCKLYAR